MSYQSFNNSGLSETRLQANRQNAQNSTGPKTPEGKLIASRNAVKTALTGRTVLLPTDDADRYQSHIQAYFEEIAPVGQRETFLAQSTADADWRLERIAGFEMAVYAKDRAFFADCYLDEPEAMRAPLIELDIYRTNERELRNLALQESRIRRQRDRDISELRYLQAERKRLIEHKQELAAYAYRQAKEEGKPFDPAELGFVFSTREIEAFIALRKAEKAIQPSAASTSRTTFRSRKAA